MRFEELNGIFYFHQPPVAHALALLPPHAHTGRPRADDRSTVDGILYVLMSGCTWRDMHPKYGSYKTIWHRYMKWSTKGVSKNIMNSLVSHGYNFRLIDISDLSADSSTVPPKRGAECVDRNGSGEGLAVSIVFRSTV